ncbi:MAG TPA: TonB-dependent receptor [Gammaproteobacteria bacterium]|nr:TonB-dependent receptor [Gammaproteobacteria bacterium]
MPRITCSSAVSRTIQLSALVVFLGLAPTGEAQELEEIIVTAQRRAENVQDVPIAMSAITGERLEARAITQVADVAAYTPNVYMDPTTPFSGSNSVLAAYIRGIGQSDFAFNLEPGVGVYVDDVYLARSIGANVDLLDVERIEVLKGPQGTLFGRNTLGGAIHVITRRPGNEFRSRGEVTLGNFDRLDVRGAADFPIIADKLYSSIAFSSKNREGYQRRIPFPGFGAFVSDSFDQFLQSAYQTADRAGGENQDNFRGKLLWVLNNDVEVTFSLDLNHTDEEGTPNSLLSFDPANPGSLTTLYNLCITLPPGAIPPCANPRGTSPAFPIAGSPGQSGAPFIVQPGLDNSAPRLPFSNAFILSDFDTSYANGNNFNKLDASGFGATVEWQLPSGVAFKYIASVRELESLFGFDFDGSPLPMLEPSFDTYQAQWSHEAQFTGSAVDDRLNWTAGAYFFHEDGDLTDYVTFPGGLLQIYGENYFDNDAWALFAHVNFALTDKLGLTIGARYTDEQKEFEGRQRDLNLIAPKSGAPPFIFPDPNDLTRYYPLGVNERDFDDFSGRLGVEYHFSDDVMGYVSYSEGFKSGGWTTRLSQPHTSTLPTPFNPIGLEFDEETATTYEIGLKSELAQRQLQWNSALFMTDYENIQVTQQVGASPVFSNGGDGEISGLETEVLWLASDQLTLTAGLGYLDAAYTRIAPGVIKPDGTPLTTNEKFVNVPETSVTVAIDYDWPLASGATIGLHADWVHNDEIANDLGNTPVLIQGTTDFFNASVSFQSTGDWRVVFGGRNLNDERHILTGQNQPAAGMVLGTYNRPREWFMTVRIDIE